MNLALITKIKRHLKRNCAVCGGVISIALYNNDTYSGGHYFAPVGATRRPPVKEQYWECLTCADDAPEED